MKKCPFCAEDIQDAAVVCRYCHADLVKRELPGSASHIDAIASRATKTGLWTVAKILLGLAGIVVAGTFALGVINAVSTGMQRADGWKNTRGANGECVLLARVVATASAESSAAQSVLAIRNGDGADWEDVEIRVYGVGTATSKDERTGIFKLYRSSMSDGLTTVNLADFSDDGGRDGGIRGLHWVPLVSHVTGVGISARLRSQKCEYERTLK